MISTYVDDDHTDWEPNLSCVTFVYNTARQATTGYMPYGLLYARDPLTALDIILPQMYVPEFEIFNADALYHAEEPCQLADFRTLQWQQSQKHRYAESHTECIDSVGDEVFFWKPARRPGRTEKLKTSKTFSGPFVVTRRISPLNSEATPVSPPADRHPGAKDIVDVVRRKPCSRLPIEPSPGPDVRPAVRTGYC